MKEKKASDKNLHDDFEKELKAGQRKKKAVVEREDGLRVVYEKEEVEGFLPHLHDEIAGVRKGLKLPVDEINLEIDDGENTPADYGPNEPIFDENLITEEEYIRDYLRDLDEQKEKQKQRELNRQKAANQKGTPITEEKSEFERKREELEKMLGVSSDGDEESPSEIFKKLQVVPNTVPREKVQYRSKEEIIALTKGKSPYHCDDNEELYNPTIQSYLRRCKEEKEAIEIIEYMEKKGEISREESENLMKKLKEQGLECFGPHKTPGYYERAFPRSQTEFSKTETRDWDIDI